MWNPVDWFSHIGDSAGGRGYNMTQEQARQAVANDPPPRSAAPAATPQNTAGMGGGIPAYDPNQVFTLGSAENRATTYGLTSAEASMQFRVNLGGPMKEGISAPRRMVDEFDAFFQYSPAEVETLQRQLYKAGFYGNVREGTIAWGSAQDDNTIKALKASMVVAARYMAAEGSDPNKQFYQATTWQDVLAGRTGSGESISLRGPGGSGTAASGPKTTTTVNLSTTGTADAYLRDAMSSLLGRAPRAAEVRRFKQRLNAAERDNPQVTVTDGADVDPATGAMLSNEVSTNVTGGFDQGDIAALARQEVGAENGVERNRFGIMDYMKAFETAIGG